jgi:hypothetical protein
MPQYLVLARAELEGVTHVGPAPKDGSRVWRVVLECATCHTKMAKYVDVDPSESEERDGGTANAFVSCKECKNGMAVSVVAPRDFLEAAKARLKALKPQERAELVVGDFTPAVASTAATGLPVAALDCRSCVPDSVQPDGPRKAYVRTGAGDDAEVGAEFEWDYGAGEEDLNEYDEASGEVVTVTGLTLSVVRA